LKLIFSGIKALFYIKVLRKNYPLALRWQLIDRCPNRCKYCNLWKNPREEMGLEDIKRVIKEVKKAGTVRISYSGGEPLLRDDIEEIIFCTKKHGISCSINTCGVLFEKKKKAIKMLDLVKISIDGREQTHDLLSGREGAFREAYFALEKSVEWGVKTVITTTLTRYNLEDVDYILKLAEKLRIFVAFQPFKIMYKGSKDENLCPKGEEYKKTIEKLIKLKKRGFPYLRNSLLSLEHIKDYPEFSPIKCSAGRLFSVVDVDGTLLPCDRNDGPYYGKLPNVLREGFFNAFKKLPRYSCSGCGFLGGKELSFFMNMKFEGFKFVKSII